MRKILNKLTGFLPVSRRKFDLLLVSLEQVLDAVNTIDAQHSQIERSIIDKLSKIENNDARSDEKGHVEFG